MASRLEPSNLSVILVSLLQKIAERFLVDLLTFGLILKAIVRPRQMMMSGQKIFQKLTVTIPNIARKVVMEMAKQRTAQGQTLV